MAKMTDIQRELLRAEQAAVSLGSARTKGVARGAYKPRTMRTGSTGTLEKYVLGGFQPQPDQGGGPGTIIGARPQPARPGLPRPTMARPTTTTKAVRRTAAVKPKPRPTIKPRAGRKGKF